MHHLLMLAIMSASCA